MRRKGRHASFGQRR